jgi:hypothetical protein
MPELPEWVTATPADHLYSLSMFENSDASIEEVHMSRDEYIALKYHLAAMPGFGIGEDPQAAIAAIAWKPLDEENNVSFSKQDQQVAGQILTARAIYKLCPDAVVYCGDSFIEKVQELAEETR